MIIIQTFYFENWEKNKKIKIKKKERKTIIQKVVINIGK